MGDEEKDDALEAMHAWREKARVEGMEDWEVSSLIREALHDFLPELEPDLWGLIRRYAEGNQL